MKKLILIIALLILASMAWPVLAQTPEATPTDDAPAERVTAAIELTTNPWLWTSFTDPVQQFDIDNPAAYTITFNTDGTFDVVADCKTTTGAYTAADDGSLSLELGPTTLQLCSPESRSDEFLTKLGSVSNFFFENGVLYLDTMADGGTFQLASASESMPAGPPRTFSEAWEAVDCATFDVPPAITDLVDCGYVTVPEFHSQPDSPTIQVAVVRARSTGDSPAPDPLFMEQGGPGGSSIDAFANKILPSVPKMQELLAGRDLVFVEQRGTLYSRPSMLCPEQTAHDLAAAQGLVDDHDLTYLQECHDRLQAEGVDLDAFNSVENAADMYAVAQALGYNSFNYYGVSYGTLLGQYVIDQADQHPVQLRSVTIDGVVAPDVEFNANSRNTGSYALRNLFTECAQSESCRQEFPDLEKVTLSLVDQLNTEPISVTLTVPPAVQEVVPDAPATVETTLDGDKLINVIFQELYQTTEGEVLPRNIFNSAQNSDYGWIEKVLSSQLEPSKVARAMYFTMLCSRQNSLVADGNYFGPPYAQFESITGGDDFARGCDIMNVAPETEEPFIIDNTDIPLLILHGTHDPITPLPYGEYVGSKMETAYVYTFPGSGHGAIPYIPCAIDMLAEFIANPTQAPDSRCVSDSQPIFLGYPTPLAELTLVEQTLPNSITLDLPSQWSFAPLLKFYMDPNNPNNYSTGAVNVGLQKDKTVADIVTQLGQAYQEIARDEPLGNYQWLILENRSNPLAIVRAALAEDADAGGVIAVQMAASPDTADEVFATLMEPILSSISYTPPAEAPAVESMAEPTAEPTTEPTAEPTTEPTAEPTE
ncbi:MAG: alpha/beta fold hydrolase [Anaerolineaceae bacterium]|nr:alpha/beta fold hydrolase [Anaerolineaceae bacterium]MCB9100750.1 alpha/beta fold hydrolase [Anaerolineales bacterium]